MPKNIAASAGWGRVADELAAEELKVASYDTVIFDRLRNIEGVRWLDYGSGPGVLAEACKRMSADIHTWDIDPTMNQHCAERIGEDRVFQSLHEMRGQLFDIITCNLVMCIVTERTVKEISDRISRLLRKDGRAFLGFCNPQIFDVPETQLDIRFPTGDTYFDHHRIPKIKKEGGYRIHDRVRPLSWYHDLFMRSGLEQIALHMTQPYKMPGSDRTIRDFVIFEQTRV